MIQAKHRNRLPLPQPAVVHVRRSYAESRFGQIHLWTAYPSGGGFDERTPVVCLHHSGGSGRLFAPMLRELGHDRSIYAPDLPGHGWSDGAGAKITVADLAGAIGDFIDSLRLRAVDLFGYQLGALVAAELAIARPQQIRRVMLWGVPAIGAGSGAPVAEYDLSGHAGGRQRCRGRVAARAGASRPGARRPRWPKSSAIGCALAPRHASLPRRRVSDARAPAAGQAADAGSALKDEFWEQGRAARLAAERLDAGLAGLRSGLPERRPAAFRVGRARIPRPLIEL